MIFCQIKRYHVYQFIDEDDFFIRLAKSLPKQKLISMENLKAENYKPLLKAENDYKKLLEKNKMDLSPFSASASLPAFCNARL